jgi:hypothetical protein
MGRGAKVPDGVLPIAGDIRLAPLGILEECSTRNFEKKGIILNVALRAEDALPDLFHEYEGRTTGIKLWRFHLGSAGATVVGFEVQLAAMPVMRTTRSGSIESLLSDLAKKLVGK